MHIAVAVVDVGLRFYLSQLKKMYIDQTLGKKREFAQKISFWVILWPLDSQGIKILDTLL